MPAKLSLAEQRKLLKALPASRVSAVRKSCRSKEMRGAGIKSVAIKARKALGPIAKEIGPTVLKEFILPMILKKAGIEMPKKGKGLKLAGQRK